MVCSFFVKHYENLARCVKLAADYVKSTKGMANGYQVTHVACVATNKIK